MQLTCNRTELIRAISLAERAVAIRNPMYVLEGLYMEAKDQTLTFISNNMELGIQCAIAADIKQEGATVVKASLFCDAVRKLPDYEDVVAISVEENMKLSCGNAKFDFSTINPDEFPKLPYIEETQSFTIGEGMLKSMLKQTMYAVAQIDSKPVLTGNYINIKDGHIVVVGCDGYRIAIRKEALTAPEEIKCIIPAKTSKELLSILSDGEEEATVTLSSNYAAIHLSHCLLITRLIEGEYFDYSSVMRHKNSLVITCETKQILDSVDRASLIVNETGKTPVILHIENDSVQINSETLTGKVNDRFQVSMSGDPIDIAFNPRYLMDAFKNCDADTIKFTFSTSVNPAIIEPVEGDKFLFVVVPMRIK